MQHEKSRTISFFGGHLYNAIKTFHNSTEILVRFIEGWIITKDNPEKIVAMKSQRNDT